MQFLYLVEGEAKRHFEPIAHRRRYQAGTGRGPDERERGEVDAQRLSVRPLSKDDVYLVVLHCRVEDLLNIPAQTVNLIDEEHIVRFEVGQDRSKVTRLLNCRA